MFSGAPEFASEIEVQGFSLPSAPVSIDSGSAKNMLAVLTFVDLLRYIISVMSSAELAAASASIPGGGVPPIVVVLDMTTDQASSNLLLARYLTWKYNTFRKMSCIPFLLMFRHGLCLTHQMSLSTRSMYGRIAGLAVLWSRPSESKTFWHPSMLEIVDRTTDLSRFRALLERQKLLSDRPLPRSLQQK